MNLALLQKGTHAIYKHFLIKNILDIAFLFMHNLKLKQLFLVVRGLRELEAALTFPTSYFFPAYSLPIPPKP